MTKNVEQMKNSQFDILVDLDKRVQVDIEMKVIVDRLELRERLTYYLTRMHGSQDLRGKFYSEGKQSIVFIFAKSSFFQIQILFKKSLFTIKKEFSFVMQSKL